MKLPRLFVMLALLPSSDVMLFGSENIVANLCIFQSAIFSFISAQYFSCVRHLSPQDLRIHIELRDQRVYLLSVIRSPRTTRDCF